MARPTPVLILGTLSLALALGVAAKPAKPAKPAIAPKAAQPAPAAAAPAAATPASAAASAAQPVPAPLPEPQAVRELEGIQEYRLANGLQVLLFPDPAATTSLTNIVYRVGSRHEGAGEAGMAHLLEHLLFKGVPSVADIPKAMSERGVRFNATTSNDRTHYFSAFNAGSDTLDFVLRLESERMQQSRVEAEDLAKEMPVVMNELQQGENNPGQLLRQRLMAAAYRFHPYGRPTIGTRSDVENVPIEALRRFYQAHYRPDNATLIVAGQFDAPATLARINALFGPLQNPAAAKPLSYTVEPPQDGERSVVVRRVGGQQTLLLAYHVPPFAHPDCAALNLLGQMLAQPPSGPLHKRFVEDEKLAAGVGAGGCGGHDPGLFNVFAVPAAGVPMEKLALPLIAAVEKREGVALSTEQFERMRNQFALGYSQLLKQPQRLAQLLTEAVAAGDWRLVFKLRRDVAALTLEDVQRVARSYLTPNNRTLARYEPAQESGAVSVPTVADRSADLDSLASQQVSAGEQLDPAPLNLQRRTQWQTLPRSGIKLALLPKRSRGEPVVGELRLRWGEAEALHAAHEAGFIGRLVGEGTAGIDRQRFIDESVRLKGGFNVSAGSQGLTLRLEGEREGFVELLRLAFQALKAPRLPTDAFERARRDAVKSLRDSQADPETIRQAAVREHYNRARGVAPGHPDYIPSLDERIERLQRVSIGQVRDFHARWWSANEGEVAFVGPLPEGLLEALDEELASWKKPGQPAFKRWVSGYRDVPPATFHAQVKDKAAAVLRLRQEVRLSSEHPDIVPLTLANHLLGGGSLESRLNVRLRQQGGLTYGAGSSLQTSDWDEDGAWTIQTSMAPENRDKVLTAIGEVLADALREGFSAAELERARKDLLEGRRQARSSDGALLGGLNALTERGQDWTRTEAWDARYRAVSLDEVNAALRKYLRPDAWVVSSAGDYEKKAQAAP